MGRKRTATVKFTGFADASEHEIGVLFEQGAIPFYSAVRALLKDGPGNHRALILCHMGKELLEKGEFEAFACVMGWWPRRCIRMPKNPVQAFLLGDADRRTLTKTFVKGKVGREEAVLLMQCMFLVDGFQDLLIDKEFALRQNRFNEIQPATAYFWRWYESMIKKAKRAVSPLELNERLKRHELCLNDDPEGAWPVKLINS